MLRILVIYGTTDGHTAKVAGAMAEAIRGRGIAADVIDVAAARPTPHRYAGVIVAASLHGSGYQRAVGDWVVAHVDALNSRPTAFVTVCLSALEATPKVRLALAAIVNRFLSQTRWRPTETKLV